MIDDNKTAIRKDESARKRIELHAHSQFSAGNCVIDVYNCVKLAASMGHKALALTDSGVVQGFPEFYRAAKRAGIKAIYGMEALLNDAERWTIKVRKTGVDKNGHEPFRVMILAATQAGLKNLYALITLSRAENPDRPAIITRDELSRHREGLIIGAAAYEGELSRAAAAGLDEETLLKIAKFYDYLEIHPASAAPGRAHDVSGLNIRIFELGKKLGKPVCAVSGVHYLDAEDEIFLKILTDETPARLRRDTGGLHYRTTEEMLGEFSYLGEAQAMEAVVDNPEKIAAITGNIVPLPETCYFASIDGAFEKICGTAVENAGRIYGDPLPPLVKARLERELGYIFEYDTATQYLLAHELAKAAVESGSHSGFRGSFGSSLFAFFLGVTGTNPLPPHYYCGDEQCRYSEFFENSPLTSGFDLADKLCPLCGAKFKKDGHDLPSEIFFGFDGDKFPDIDLTFLPRIKPKIIEKMRELFGRDKIISAGEISTISLGTAINLVINYYARRGLKVRPAEVRRLAEVLKSSASGKMKVHRSGYFIVPADRDIHQYSPLDAVAMRRNKICAVPHFDNNDIDRSLWKQDIHDCGIPLRIIDFLRKLTGVSVDAIHFDDVETLSIFSGLGALNISPEDIGGIKIGTLGIEFFDGPFMFDMLDQARPEKFGDLVCVLGLSFGTDTWTGNAAEILRTGEARLSEVISTRDDIINYLTKKGLQAKFSYDVMERVRKGKGLRPEMELEMENNNIPRWFMRSCHKIKYIFPKAHIVHYTMTAFRNAYFKVHHPLAFYRAYFTVNKPSPALTAAALKGRNNLIAVMDAMAAVRKGRQYLCKEYYYAALMLECLARGFKFYPPGGSGPDRKKFRIGNSDGIILSERRAM